MQQKEAMQAIRDLGMTVSVNDGEYRVNIPEGKEATAYYTDSPEDAVATARAMKDCKKQLEYWRELQ